MFNCKSNEERHQWIARIRTAIPNAVIPKSERKEPDIKQEEPVVEKPSTEKEDAPTEKNNEAENKEEICITPPPLTDRQETVDEAALLAASSQHDGESM